MIPYGKHDVTQEDIQAVVDVLENSFLTQGSKVPELENKIAELVGCDHCVAANSATSSLHLACMALGLSKGDILWTSGITFAASANCARYCGADVDFVDIDIDTYNICCEALEEKLNLANKQSKLPKVLVVVHLTGQSCDMKRIHSLCERFGVRIIEDASHAIGGKYRGDFIGNCNHSDITIFSFHPVKLVTTAEGGVAATNQKVLAEKMALLRSHGITRDPDQLHFSPDGSWYYEQLELGYNYRMSDLHAALGISQLDRLNAYVERRNEIAREYDRLLGDLPVHLPRVSNECLSAFHLYVVRMIPDAVLISHSDLFEELHSRKIAVNLHYIPVYHHPYYTDLGFKKGYLPNCEAYYSTAISLPIFPGLSNAEQKFVVETLENLL